MHGPPLTRAPHQLRDHTGETAGHAGHRCEDGLVLGHSRHPSNRLPGLGWGATKIDARDEYPLKFHGIWMQKLQQHRNSPSPRLEVQVPGKSGCGYQNSPFDQPTEFLTHSHVDMDPNPGNSAIKFQFLIARYLFGGWMDGWMDG